MRYIGDVHGKLASYKKIIAGCEESIQLGDFGVGFCDFKQEEIKHRFVRGNHDNPELCKKYANWIPDGTYENGMFVLGGGFSTDRAMRTPGIDWWADEELSYPQLMDMIVAYENLQPEVVCSHVCPTTIAMLAFNVDGKSRTQQAMDVMFKLHKPALWVFGHHHKSIDKKFMGTRFICLGELQFIDI